MLIMDFDQRSMQSFLIKASKIRRDKGMSQAQYLNYLAIELLENTGNSAPAQSEIDEIENKYRVKIQRPDYIQVDETMVNCRYFKDDKNDNNKRLIEEFKNDT